MKILQDEREIDICREVVRRLQPRAILEIGSASGGTLWEWLKLGIPHVVSVDVNHDQLNRTELEAVLKGPADGWDETEHLARAARAVVERSPFPPELESLIRSAHRELCGRSGLGDDLETAVRSSGIAEDGDEASFAGQFDTYPAVPAQFAGAGENQVAQSRQAG